MGYEYLEEKTDKVMLKVFMAGGSVMYFVLRWEEAQLTLREFKYFLRWKYAPPSKENYEKLIEESEFKRKPFINYFFQRKDGELDGVIDFASVSGIMIDNPPEKDALEKSERYSRAMTKMAEVQAKFMQKMLDDHEKGDEWRKGKEGERG